jgi:type III secretory pathway lipoprotein EscJ
VQLLAVLKVTVRTPADSDSEYPEPSHAAALAGDSLSVKLTARVVAIKKIAKNKCEVTDMPCANELRTLSAKIRL